MATSGSVEPAEETHKNPYLEGFSTVIMNGKKGSVYLVAKNL